MSFEDTLHKIIPGKIDVFPKLTIGHDPYYFDEWNKADNSVVLRYWFWNKTKTRKNKKRVFIDEITELLNNLYESSIITRDDFRAKCPRTKSDGECGFAVILRILEYLQIVEIKGGEYRITGGEKVQEIIN